MIRKAVSYCRVSSKEQEISGFSIPSQLKTNNDYSNNNNMVIVKEFIDSETAKASGRTEFNAMIQFIKKHNIKIILVEKTDRLYRNFEDYVIIFKLDVEVHFIKENQILSRNSRSHEKLVHGFKLLMAKNYIDNLSEEIRKGQLIAIQGNGKNENGGRWVFGAVRGYSYDHSGNHPLLVPDQDAPMIVDCFKTMVTGVYNVEQCRKFINNKYNAKLAKTTFHRILRNHIYCGLIKVKTFPEIYKGIHQAIVSQKLFFAVQDILAGKKTHFKPPQIDNPDFPLRGFVICSKCGKPMTGGWSKGKTKKYAYYRCRYCNLNVKREILESKFVAELKRLEPTEDVFIIFEATFKHLWAEHNKLNSKYIANLKGQITKLESRKSRILDMFIDKDLDKSGFDLKIKETESELLKLNIQLTDSQKEYDTLEEEMSFAKLALSGLSKYWQNISSLDFRRRLQKMIFPHGIEFDGQNCRTLSILPIFNMLLALDTQISPQTDTTIKEDCRTLGTVINFNELGGSNSVKVPNGGALGTNVEHLKYSLVSIFTLNDYKQKMKVING